MAGDWIKMRSGLLTNPKVIRMARSLASNRFFMDWWTRGTNKHCDDSVYEMCDVTVVTRVTVGSLLSVWAAVNECASEDGFVKGITLFEVDEMAGAPGFGDAMVTVGWVEEEEDGLLFPNFHEHNTVGKQRSTGAKSGAERTKEWRKRKAESGGPSSENGDVSVTSQRDHREEKRREEIKEPPISPKGGETGSSRKPQIALQTFLEDCKAKGERPLRDYAPLWEYARAAKLDTNFVSLAWAEFSRQFLPGGTHEAKRQKDWRLTFRNYVEKNYLKLWAIDGDGRYFLTTTGKQAEKFHETKAAA